MNQDSHIPRITCPCHGVKTIQIEWADEKVRFNRGLSRRRDEVISSIGMDEKNFLAGYSYVTVMTDNQGKRVIDVAENRDENAVAMRKCSIGMYGFLENLYFRHSLSCPPS